MNIHVLDEDIFFQTSVPIADQQRLVVVPPARSAGAGDIVFLRDPEGQMTWVADVLSVGHCQGPEAWGAGSGTTPRPYLVLGWIARIHPGTLPRGRARFQASWVTLNSRTIETALPWWNDGVIVYHATVHLIEGIVTSDELSRGERAGCILPHPSGHWIFPHGEARKRFLVDVRGVKLECGLCGTSITALEEATQDHVIPISQGGADTLVNVQLAHRSCNEVKGNCLPEQYPPFFAPPRDASAASRMRRGGRRNGRDRTPRRSSPAALPALPSALRRELVATPGTGNGIPDTQQGVETAAAVLAPPATTPAGAEAEVERLVPGQEASVAGTVEETLAAETTQEVLQGAGPEPQGEADDLGEASDAAWLRMVEDMSWSQLRTEARRPDWAARTARLRTLEQIRRSQVASALQNGRLVSEHEGPKGRFSLLEWNQRYILVEERHGRKSCYVIRILQSLSPAAYTWFLSRYGRKTPLAVATLLLSLWKKGVSQADGSIQVRHGDTVLKLRVEEDRLVSCAMEEAEEVA